ncbi:MAG: SCO family protein [Chloroflexota bacterium]|nr:MAG: SCO family protein [Chloroflexota bacterium]
MQPLRVLLLLACAVALAGCGSYSFRGTELEPPEPAPDFTLTGEGGQTFRLSDQRGSVVLLFFGFTNCPDVCPTALAEAAAVKRELGADGERLQVVMVSVDPERDTPEITGRYAKRFDPSFIGLSGTRDEIEPVLRAYGVMATRRDLPGSALEYTVDHSAYMYAIDPAGRWRLIFSPGTPVSDIASDVRHLLRAGGGS